MNKSTIIQLVEDIARVTLDPDTIARYYDDALEDVCKFDRPPLVTSEMIEITAGTATYDYPTDAVKIVNAFYDSTQLLPCIISALDAYSDDWRDDSGDPWAFTRDETDKDTYTLYPNPQSSSGAFSFPNAAPMGEDFPDDTVVLIYSQRRDDDIPDWLVFVLVFDILAREFARPSDHQDAEFSDACRSASQLFLVAARMV